MLVHTSELVSEGVWGALAGIVREQGSDREVDPQKIKN